VRARRAERGSDSDNAKEIFDRYRDFDIQVVRHAWGVQARDPQRAGGRPSSTAR
jgi:hypothetical protein